MMANGLEEILETFEFLDDWEDRFEYLISLGKDLPGLPDADKVAMNKVEGCTSQVWMVSALEEGKLIFNADSDAHIVRGLIAVLLAAYSGKTPQDVQALDIDAAFQQMGLDQHLSPNRRNGFTAMVGRINATAQTVLEASAG